MIARDTPFFCHAITTGHRVRFVDGLPGASLPRDPDALHISLIFQYLLVFCSSDAVAVLGDSGRVVNSLDFCQALLKSLGCFYFR